MGSRPVASPPTAPFEPRVREFVELVCEHRELHQRDWRNAGFRALLAYRLGRLRHALHPRWTIKPVTVLSLLLQRRAQGRFGIELFDTARIGRRVRIIHQSGIVIHGYATVGDGCWIRNNVAIGSRNDWSREDVATIGRSVRIGSGAIVGRELTIGDGARIGPNAVVLEDVAEGVTVLPPKSEIRERRASRDGPGAGR